LRVGTRGATLKVAAVEWQPNTIQDQRWRQPTEAEGKPARPARLVRSRAARQVRNPTFKTTAPDIKSMQIHHDARHPNYPVNLRAAAVDPNKPRPGVH
ncbi:hypothetical protein Tsubulata_038643, partial [Turnera subulata]